jgi:hypothetical protein
MSYTNIQLVKRHVIFGNQPGGPRRDFPVDFSGSDIADLPGRSIAAGSVTVKSLQVNSPFRETIVPGTEPYSLVHDNIVPGSMAVASDNSGGTIFVENVDYSVNYPEGQLTVMGNGDIEPGTSLTSWYFYYTPYEENLDFSVDYQAGRIKRLAGGRISDGQSVLVDYRAAAVILGDDIIREVVSEANALIDSEIDRGRSFGADPTLQTAATCLAVSLLFRVVAGGELAQLDPSGKVAASWLTLAKSYREDYDRLIRSFHPTARRPSGPARS